MPGAPATPTTTTNEAHTRLRVTLRGAVQGVGFRPFVFRLATELGLTGWVNNSPQGVRVEVEGPPASAEAFLLRLEAEKPPRSSIQGLETTWLDPAGHREFEIRANEHDGQKTVLVTPDIATCHECRREIFSSTNRRFRYPFTNCTCCGPRFSIIQSLPYDRANTSMGSFTMCPQCQAEYDDPHDRRFHAQPNACPACGPHLELWDADGRRLAAHDTALSAAVAAIRQGLIVAVKGLGGFHLIVAAHDESAVRRLRERKHREEKPFALLFPSLESLLEQCEVSPLEERLLRSPEAPIVLLRRKSHTNVIAPSVATGNPYLGVLLPYTPIHHLLAAELGVAVVATSGNRSDEPICTDEREALEQLAGIADCFLVHNRPIVRHVDDSIVRVVAGRELVLRRARGFAPLPIQLPAAELEGLRPQSLAHSEPRHVDCYKSVMAVGAHLKSTVALSVERQVIISQHISDLKTARALTAFSGVVADLTHLYEARPEVIAVDAHPDYLSTQFAQQRVAHSPTTRLVTVQHHYAHVLSCMGENELEPPALGVCWDGTGYGLDGTIWGGEFLRVTPDGFERVAHLRPFRLPGGEQCMREPRRAALGLLYECLGEEAFRLTRLPTLDTFSTAELRTLRQMLAHRVNAPLTSSVGRLFDAVASLLGLRQVASFEGQAAMEIEFAADAGAGDAPYEITLTNGMLDWAPMIHDLLNDIDQQIPSATIAAKFHHALVDGIVAVAHAVGEERVVLTGGCFQNKRLTECAVNRLADEGFRPYWHQRVPPNDGGIALGQVLAAARALAGEKSSCV